MESRKHLFWLPLQLLFKLTRCSNCLQVFPQTGCHVRRVLQIQWIYAPYMCCIQPTHAIYNFLNILLCYKNRNITTMMPLSQVSRINSPPPCCRSKQAFLVIQMRGSLSCSETTYLSLALLMLWDFIVYNKCQYHLIKQLMTSKWSKIDFEYCTYLALVRAHPYYII